jgi:hypothetical protein
MTILSTQIVPISKEYTIFMRFSTFFSIIMIMSTTGLNHYLELSLNICREIKQVKKTIT